MLVGGSIVETEAYTQTDPASHSFKGPTVRNAVMFGPPGRLYVYLSYGIHCCANVVTGAEGDGQAVLLRAIMPTVGLDVIRSRRRGRSDRDLANGPGKLCEALGIGLDDDGVDVTSRTSPIRIVDDATTAHGTPIVGPRVGLGKAIDTPWRFRSPGT